MAFDRLRRLTKPVTASLGMTSADLWQGLALRRYRQKERTNTDYQQWLSQHGARWIRNHWGHYEQTGDFQLAHVSSQLFEITRLLQRRIGEVNDLAVLDAGASDGMFLSLLNVHDGTGLNFLPACVEKIKADGFSAVQGDVEHMPFPDKQFDIVLCCETLEHVLNPIHALNELARVCRGKIHLTIPWLPATRLNQRPAGWPETESHVFEFSQNDFAKIVTFSRVRVTHHDLIHVFPAPKNPLLNWWFGKWMYPNYFPRLQYYELEPR